MREFVDLSDLALSDMRARVGRSMELMAESLGTSVSEVGACMVIVVAETYGKKGLQPIAYAVQELTKFFKAQEVAEARELRKGQKLRKISLL